MRVLLVDDDEIALELLQATLSESGYEIEVATNGRHALEILRTGCFRMVISDWEMPEMTGVELCREIRKSRITGYIYVILLTARDGNDSVVEGLNAGADDFITKPFHPTELCVRVRAGERILSLDSRDLIIFSLAKLAEARDPETGAHLERIREYSRILAQFVGSQQGLADDVDGEYTEMIYLTSPLHDIGKVGIPDNVLLKAGRLSDREFEIMKTHTTIGAETLGAALEERPEVGFLHMARDIALTHHERFDGSGYPAGLVGRQIPLCGRIVAIADVYDALTSKRVYKEEFNHDVARSVILEGSGVHFDPDLIDCFREKEQEFAAVRDRFARIESGKHTQRSVATSCTP